MQLYTFQVENILLTVLKTLGIYSLFKSNTLFTNMCSSSLKSSVKSKLSSVTGFFSEQFTDQKNFFTSFEFKTISLSVYYFTYLKFICKDAAQTKRSLNAPHHPSLLRETIISTITCSVSR